MKRLLLSPKAKSDLNSIWDYTVERWGIEQGEAYIRELWGMLATCLENPEQATSAQNIRSSYRKAFSSSHVIYFKETANGIHVVRILHERMDF